MKSGWRAAMVALGIWATACSQTPAEGGGGGGEPARILEQGASSSYDVSTDHELVADDAARWNAIYRAHMPGSTAPEVDFALERVVGVILARPTGGYGVRLLSVLREGEGTLVRYRESQPGPDAVVIQVLTQPFFFAAVPRWPGPVRFSREVVQAQPF